MRYHLLPLLLAAGACAPAPATAPAAAPQQAESRTALQARLDRIAEIEMRPDTSYLSAEEKQVVNLLIQASDLMTPIYLRQRDTANPATLERIKARGGANRDLLVKLFERNLGPWDETDEQHPFFGDRPMPPGAGFYPADLTKAEFDAYLAAHPEQKESLTSLYTVVRRDGDRLKAVPYSVEYREWLEPAAKLMEQAAAITSNASLKTFLTLRARAFRTDDYYASELAWMDLADTPIEIAIGPYEVYTDKLYGAKAAFESFLTLKSPEESAALAKYKQYLRDMEANLPIDERHKNFQRGFASPIVVADQIRGGGDNVPGSQTIAFNLPNDERVREAKGAKKVILANVLGAKYDRIAKPMASLILVPDQAALVSKKYMLLETLFHELSHSLGPGTITVDGRKTSVNEELKEQASALEEAKADVAGAWNLMFMMEKGELPAAEKPQLLATVLGEMFRHMRVGITEAHGKGAALQYGYLKARGAFVWNEYDGRYRVDPVKMEAGLRALLHDILLLQATGDYEGVKALFARWAVLDEHAETVIGRMSHIPIDIRPDYPARI